jgi:RNA polymerase sigma factor (sigma-70 family)
MNENALIAEKIPMARALARRLMWQWHVVGMDEQDITQEGMIGYLRAMRRHNDNPGTASLNTYAEKRMIGAMMDAITDPMRAQKRIPNHAITDIEEALDVSGEDGRDWVDAMHAQQMLERAYQSFADLPSKQRQAMELIYITGLSQREVARQINVTEGNVSILHSRAVKKLRKLIN